MWCEIMFPPIIGNPAFEFLMFATPVNGDDLTPQFRQVGRRRKNKMFTKLKVSKSFPKSQFFLLILEGWA